MEVKIKVQTKQPLVQAGRDQVQRQLLPVHAQAFKLVQGAQALQQVPLPPLVQPSEGPQAQRVQASQAV